MFGRFRFKREGDAAWRERRRTERQAVRAPAEIVVRRDKPYPCFTVNVSRTGAKLECPRSTILPGEFEVAIPAKRIRRKAKLVWRGEDTIGVQFL